MRTILFTMVSLLTLLPGCGGDPDDTGAALIILALAGSVRGSTTPACTSSNYSFTFTSTGTTYPQNAAIQTNSASFTKLTGNPCTGDLTASSFSVTPALPTGMTMDVNSGNITGTPTATQGSTTYNTKVTISDGTTASRQVYFGVHAVAASITCNTVGTFAGCTAGSPFSCTNSFFCYNTYAKCRDTSSCNYYL